MQMSDLLVRKTSYFLKVIVFRMDKRVESVQTFFEQGGKEFNLS